MVEPEKLVKQQLEALFLSARRREGNNGVLILNSINMSKFVIARSTNQKYYFNLKADNGEVILTSEMYEAKSGCQNGIVSVKNNAPYDYRYNRLQARNGQFYFVLKAANGEIVGNSEMYVARSGMENGIASVKMNAPRAEIIDIS